MMWMLKRTGMVAILVSAACTGSTEPVDSTRFPLSSSTTTLSATTTITEPVTTTTESDVADSVESDSGQLVGVWTGTFSWGGEVEMTIDSAPIEPGELVGQIMHTGTLDHCLMDLYAVEPSVSDYQMEELVSGPEEVGCAEGDVYLDHVGQNLSYRFVAHGDADDTGTAVLRPKD